MAEINWTTVGAEYTTEDRRAELQEVIDGLEWHPVTLDMTAPAMPGMAIDAFLHASCGWQGVRQIAWNGAIDYPDPHPEASPDWMAHYALYGIEKAYSNGVARIYLLDTGTCTVCIRSDFTPKTEEATA